MTTICKDGDGKEKEIRENLISAGQEHLLAHVDSLQSDDREKFLNQLSSIKVDQIEDIYKASKSASEIEAGEVSPFVGKPGRSSDTELVSGCKELGMKAISQTKVAALVLAGGQGTRLGFSGPKGMYDIGLTSGRSLFEMMSLRIRRLQALADDENAVIPFYIMTSPMNHDETVKYFKSNSYFGLSEANVFFFPQGTLPCITEEGKIILEEAGKVAVAPDGNGGIYPALESSGALADMEFRGIEFIHVFSIDNALVIPADPAFIGFCALKQADCGNKAVWKAHAHEKVGVVASRSGKPCIVEYSEISKEMAESVDAEGRLVFGAGNICNHFYTLAFLKDKVLPNMDNMYHIAHKKIPYYDPNEKKTVKPTSNNGIKLETFIFDVFPLSERMAVFQTEREEEFAPVKNAPGSASDSPDTARAMISALAKKWLLDAGAKLVGDVEGGPCEISPLVSYSGEGLDEYNGKEVVCPFSL